MSILEELTISPAASYEARPFQDHVTIRDVDMGASHPCVVFDMHQPLADPCPQCGAFRLVAGDYVCVGVCDACWDKSMAELETERGKL